MEVMASDALWTTISTGHFPNFKCFGSQMQFTSQAEPAVWSSLCPGHEFSRNNLSQCQKLLRIQKQK
jgi:hypothetical protein